MGSLFFCMVLLGNFGIDKRGCLCIVFSTQRAKARCLVEIAVS